MPGFQKQVNYQQAPAVEGDFASANPRVNALTAESGLRAGVGGARVGRFGWIGADGVTTYNRGANVVSKPDGFVHRQMNALITAFLAESSMTIRDGMGMALLNEGDFWVINAGPGAVNRGDQVYTSYADGASYSALPSPTSGTGVLGSTNTAALGSTFTATGTGTSLAVSALTGYLAVGDTIVGTGVPIGTTITAQVSGTTGAAGTYTTSVATTATAATVTSYGLTVQVSAATAGIISIGDTISGGAGFPVGATVVAQVSGTAGGVGVYTLSARGSAYTASATGVTTFGYTFSVTAASGTFAVGDPVSGTGFPTNGMIDSQVSGTAGGIGVYKNTVRGTAYAASTALTVVAGVLTNFNFRGSAAVGELVQISSWGN